MLTSEYLTESGSPGGRADTSERSRMGVSVDKARGLSPAAEFGGVLWLGKIRMLLRRLVHSLYMWMWNSCRCLGGRDLGVLHLGVLGFTPRLAQVLCHLCNLIKRGWLLVGLGQKILRGFWASKIPVGQPNKLFASVHPSLCTRSHEEPGRLGGLWKKQPKQVVLIGFSLRHGEGEKLSVQNQKSDC